MCGITGFIQAGSNPEQRHQFCSAMADTIAHRGPDDHGVWVDPELPLALGHRRLSIIDLSTAGAQPMVSASERYVLAYNGEVYNFSRLRQHPGIARYPFRGHSDTEVILAAVEQLGIEQTLPLLEGMFALALWDRQERCLWLARDRAGKKPLYYGWNGDSLLFGSELKALRAHPEFRADIDRDALGQYLQYGWVSQPRSIYASTRKLPPGHYLKIPLGSQPWQAEPTEFWSARTLAEQAQRAPFEGAYDDAVDALEATLREAVNDRMVADVDLGALLSGGIDSSTVVALMQQISDRPIKTFCIGFAEKQYNEAEYARAVAEHLGTEHHEMYITPDQALDTLSSLPQIYDEPFADSSQIPTYLVSKLAREQVTVVLTGDGGDESMAGYRRYMHALKDWRKLQRIPGPARQLLAQGSTMLADLSWQLCSSSASGGQQTPDWARKLAKQGRRADMWRATHPQQLLANRFNNGIPVDRYIAGATPFAGPLTAPALWPDVDNPQLQMLHYDYHSYLSDDILVKVDRASMAVSLEARAPLLDTRVLELAWSLPNDYLLRDKVGKRVLRDVLMRHVPRELIDRPKRGFSVPIKEWLVGPLRDWVEDLLNETALRQQGIFRADKVRRAWLQHLSGWTNHSELLWSILMFQAWWHSQRTTLS